MKRSWVLGLLLLGCHREKPRPPRPDADPLAQACLAGDHGRAGTYCSSAATFYELGEPATRDFERAEQFWKLACAAHEPHPNGPEWPCFGVIRVGCKRGRAADCLELGRRLAQGIGGASKDLRGALRALATACDAGAAEGCTQADALRAAATSSAAPGSPPAAP